MEKETLKKIFTFLEENGEHNAPVIWKLMNNEPLTDEELFVEGDLNLINSKIKSLPKDLEVGGFLDLSYSLINSLPEGLIVGGALSLFDCTNITSLPEGLKVGRNLDLGFTKITSLPKGLKVGGYIDLNGTKLAGYSDDELRKMVKPGYIKGRIIKV